MCFSSGPFQNAHPKIFSILCEMGGVADSGASSSSVLPQTHLMVQSSKFSFLTSVFISTYKDLTIISTWKFHLFIFVDRNLFTPFAVWWHPAYNRGHYCPSLQQTPSDYMACFGYSSVVHGNNRVTAATASFANGSFTFPKGGSAATNAAQQKALTCPLNAKPTLGISKSGDPCSGVLFPKACGRHV